MGNQATERMVVSASPKRCFAVVSDPERYPDWIADIKEAVVNERDSEGRPTSVTFRAAAFGRSTSYTLAYDYSGAPSTVSWKLTEGDITTRLDGVYVFEPTEDDRTEVTYHLEVELRVPIPGFIKLRAQNRIMTTALRELKAQVESAA